MHISTNIDYLNKFLICEITKSKIIDNIFYICNEKMIINEIFSIVIFQTSCKLNIKYNLYLIQII
jgi:hypothetical protein